MKNRFSNLLANIPVEGQAIFRIALIIFVMALVSLPFYLYVAVQTNAWQLYAVVGITIAGGLATAVSAALAKRNRVGLAIGVIIGIVYLALPLFTAILSGVGIGLSIALVLIVTAIAGQTLSGPVVPRLLISAIVLAVINIIVDLYAPWERMSIPFLKTAVPLIAIVVVFVLSVLVVRQFPTFSLRTKLIIISTGIAFIAAGGTASITNLVVSAALTRQVSDNVETLVETIAQNIGNSLSAQLEILQVAATRFERIAESASLQYSGSAEDIQRSLLARDQVWRAAAGTDPIVLEVVNNNTASLLRDFRRTVPAHVEIFLTDVYGANIAATNRTTDYYQADEDWWQVAYNNGQGAIFISQPVYDESSETFALEMAVPVFANGRLVGILRSTYEASVLTQVLENAKSLNTGHADIRIAKDLLLGAGQTELQVIDPETQAQLAQLEEQVGPIFFEGEEVLAARAPVTVQNVRDPHNQAIANLGWAVIVHQNVREALTPVETATRTIILVSVGILLGTGVLAYYISFTFSTPIVKLTEVAEKVRAGNLEVQAEITSQDEIGTLATSFNSMTAQVRTLVSTLEQRVADRTRALATATEISRRLSTILNQDELVRAVVEQVQQAFHYYHAHIYLWDEEHENLVMAGGTGEAGRLMLESGHSIPAERGLVGRAAETGTVILVPDVTQTIGWLPNPLLPDTKAEIAVPIVLGEEILGVLDIQQNVIGGLGESDADLLQAIANQVAIALQNARAYAMAQQQATRETRRSEIIHKIQSATSVDEALKVAVREVGRALGQETLVHLDTMQNGQ